MCVLAASPERLSRNRLESCLRARNDRQQLRRSITVPDLILLKTRSFVHPYFTVIFSSATTTLPLSSVQVSSRSIERSYRGCQIDGEDLLAVSIAPELAQDLARDKRATAILAFSCFHQMRDQSLHFDDITF
jgi:hypothetical protein